MDKQKAYVPRLVAAAAVVLGLVGGSYGIASAASGSGASSNSGSGSNGAAAQLAAGNRAAPGPGTPWGGQRSDESLLTGEAKASVQKAAQAKVPNGTIVRIETDADGNGAYEAHMTKADGTPITVYVDRQFKVVSVESRGERNRGGVPSTGVGAPPAVR
jgi:hypothetical protein